MDLLSASAAGTDTVALGEDASASGAGATALGSEADASGRNSVASDAAGNLTSDGGLLFREMSRLGGGIAIAMSLENPDLVAGESFSLAGNTGFGEGNVALGFTAVGAGERWALSGGVGFTVKDGSCGGRNSQSSIGGRAGLQVSC